MATKVATISLTATSDKAANVTEAFRKLDEAVQGGAEWILLPEVFTYHGPYRGLKAAAEPDKGPLYTRLAEFARDNKIVLFAGSFAVLPEDKTSERVFNRMYVFGRDGTELARYTKTHLFNLHDADGAPLYCESDGYIPGEDTSRFSLDGFEVGLAICYDLRFSGFYQALVGAKPLDVLINAAAFTKETGKAHWELLLRARSVEYQAYSIAANQVGEHSPGKESFGHSMVVDPWGEVLANTGDKPGIAFAELSRDRIQQVRSKLPATTNTRPELYK